MRKVADFIAEYLATYGVDRVFMVTGGGAMHLNDSFGKHQDTWEIVFHHHEQACAIAAEGYSRTTGKLGVVNVTTGPGGLNTLTGVMGQWTDSVPVLYISGQVKTETTIAACPDVPLRQLGDQEVDIVRIVRPITKYAVTLQAPQDVKKVVQEAIFHATTGRPGPVWIDVPMNIQGALVDEDALAGFVAPEKPGSSARLSADADAARKLLAAARRPVIIAGHGIRLGKALESFREFLAQHPWPVVTTFNGFDLVPSDHPQYIGRIGTVGDRAGNFALQNADVVLSLGSRNNVRQTSYTWKNFARAAKKIVVDIDPAELAKPTVKPDLAVAADVKFFLKEINAAPISPEQAPWGDWLAWCQARKHKYPVVLAEYQAVKGGVQPYWFMQVLTAALPEGAVCVAGNGTACVTLFQAGIVKKHQRIFWNSG
ncbi:MAG: thiamine pyrophosphate-binding protein, partial [Candidatus Firestonebacteria bacterium]|nr:thiamine pyrophosphate-binding protein [Candidatus Firestonebacteria bacterium]